MADTIPCIEQDDNIMTDDLDKAAAFNKFNSEHQTLMNPKPKYQTVLDYLSMGLYLETLK